MGKFFIFPEFDRSKSRTSANSLTAFFFVAISLFLFQIVNTGNNRHLTNAYKSLLTHGRLNKLVLCNSSSVIFPGTDLSPKTHITFRRWSNNHQIVTERLGSKMINDIYTSLNCTGRPGWDTYINRLKCTPPFGQNDAKVS